MQEAVLVHTHSLAGEDHRGGGWLFDDQRPGERRPGRQQIALVSRCCQETFVEYDLALSLKGNTRE